jgi:hypothetical protein
VLPRSEVSEKGLWCWCWWWWREEAVVAPEWVEVVLLEERLDERMESARFLGGMGVAELVRYGVGDQWFGVC